MENPLQQRTSLISRHSLPPSCTMIMQCGCPRAVEARCVERCEMQSWQRLGCAMGSMLQFEAFQAYYCLLFACPGTAPSGSSLYIGFPLFAPIAGGFAVVEAMIGTKNLPLSILVFSSCLRNIPILLKSANHPRQMQLLAIVQYAYNALTVHRMGFGMQ